ncbi:HTH domain-containing protein [Nonomuraea wenchangensis]
MPLAPPSISRSSRAHTSHLITDPLWEQFLRVIPAPGEDDTDTTEAELLLRIRRDTEGRGLTVRTLAERHGVSRRTVRRASRTPEPPPSQAIRRRLPQAIKPFSALVDPMLAAGLALRRSGSG